MAWELLSATVVKITKKRAEEMLSLESPPYDRLLSERRLMVYERAIREGLFRPCVWAKAACEETGETYRVNGQHTATAFSRLADEFPGHHAMMESYRCETLEDVGKLYATFDAAIQSRTASDVNRSFANTIPELRLIARRIIDASASGISLHVLGGNESAQKHLSPMDRAEKLIEHPEFVVWVASMISGANDCRWMQRAGVIGAMFGSYQKAKGKAEEFWTLVRTKTGPRPTCPDRRLGEWLMLARVNNGMGGNVPKKRQATAREFYVRSTHCWNAWRRGEDLKIVRYSDSDKAPAFA